MCPDVRRAPAGDAKAAAVSGAFRATSGRALPCPCGSGVAYAVCCRPLHDGERSALTAEELMRSRYAAFVVGAGDYLVRTWHPAHRPVDLALDPEMVWAGLEVLDTRAGGPDDDQGEVEFRASWRHGRDRGVLHERSRFTRRAGRWVYVDGDLRD